MTENLPEHAKDFLEYHAELYGMFGYASGRYELYAAIEAVRREYGFDMLHDEKWEYLVNHFRAYLRKNEVASGVERV